MDPEDLLQHYWGHPAFRPCQREIINSVLAGRDTVGLMPTGGGKSVTFQIPALILDGITVVVTPLISLMKDQVDNLANKGIKAVCMNSLLTRAEADVAYDKVRLGKVKILYVSPEKLAKADFQLFLAHLPVKLIVVDEAHCISQWGYDFRPSYLEIFKIRDFFPATPILALTASATPAVVADIEDKLHMRSPEIHKLTFARNNISYLVRYAEIKEEMLLQILRNTSGSAIVYCRSRQRTAVLANLLKQNGISADFYHAGIEPKEKIDKQDAWRTDKIRVIVATNAFGMGIDKPDVRVVVHFDLPPSLEEYYQEAGRCGRDGNEAFAVLIVATPDKAILKRRVKEAFPPREVIRNVYEKLCVFLNIAIGEGSNRLYECNITKFCDTFRLPPRSTRAALNILTRAGVIEFDDNPNNRSRVMIIVQRSDLYNIDLSENEDVVLNALLRLYPGLFADFISIDEVFIGYITSFPRQEVYEILLLLSKKHIIQYIPKRSLPAVYFPTRREQTKNILIPKSVYEDELDKATMRMKAVEDYVFGSHECRTNNMLRYFGEESAAHCGKCDICRERARSERKEQRQATVNQLLDELFDLYPEGFTIEILRQVFPHSLNEAVTILRNRIDSGCVRLNKGIFQNK